MADDENTVQELTEAKQVRQASAELVAGARRSVHIYSRSMDPALYNNREFLEAMTQFLTSHPRAYARMLVQDAESAIRNDHRLIHLARRLSSRFAIREPGPRHRDYNAAFLIVDVRAVLYREMGDRFEATVDREGRARARQLVRYHDEVWEFGQANPNLRALSI